MGAYFMASLYIELSAFVIRGSDVVFRSSCSAERKAQSCDDQLPRSTLLGCWAYPGPSRHLQASASVMSVLTRWLARS